MAATTTLAVGTGGLAAGAAVLGAIGLGAAAIGALLSGGNRRRGGRRRGHHRGRREVQEETDRLERFLQVIRYEDVTGCALRLACEIAGMKEEELAIEELATGIKVLLSPLTEPGQGLLPPDSASADFKAAVIAGDKRQNCAKEFPVCPYNSTVMMNTIDYMLP